MTYRECMKGFIPQRVYSRQQIDEINRRCEDMQDDVNQYGDWLIRQQKEEEHKQYLLRCARREEIQKEKAARMNRKGR